MKFFNIFIFLVSFILVFFLPACDETLPEYQAPPNVVIGGIIQPGSVGAYRFNIVERFPTSPQFYKVIFVGIDSLIFRFEVQNVYEEVIEDKADVGGYVKIWDPILPDNYATVPLTQSSLTPNRDTLRIRPGDKAWLRTTWKKLMYDDGSWPWVGKPNEDYGEGRIRYKPITLKAKAYIRLYKKLGFVVTPEINFTLDIISTIYDP